VKYLSVPDPHGSTLIWLSWIRIRIDNADPDPRVSDPDPYPDLDPHSFELLDPDPDPHSNCGSGSGSRRAKMTHKNIKKSRIFMFLSTGCSLLRAEGFSCSLGVLYGGLGISKLQFLINKIEIKFPAINFFQFKVIKPRIRIRDPNPGSGPGIRIRN
jgi:hypothetical protein